MTYFEASFPEMIGTLTIVAPTLVEAMTLFDQWYCPRLGSAPHHVTMREAPEAAAKFDHLEGPVPPGIACCIAGHGWITIPPTMDAPGPYYLEPRPVRCFQVAGAGDIDDGPVLLFAASEDDADAIYAVLSRLRYEQEPEACGYALVDLDSLPDEWKGLREAAALGCVGVAGMNVNGATILPPWDLAAGELF